MTVTAQGRLTTPEQFCDIVVKTRTDGRITYLGDIGRVELGGADYSTGSEINGRPSVGLAIAQLPGTNAIATSNAVRAKMAELEARGTWPPGLAWSVPYDTTILVRDSLKDMAKRLFEGVALVALVVPVSLVGTFAVLCAAGFSLNTLSLFGLVLAIGIVVDDAIVVVENVERLIATGLSPRDATYKAMEEVTPAVIAIAFGLSAVFIPWLLVLRWRAVLGSGTPAAGPGRATGRTPCKRIGRDAYRGNLTSFRQNLSLSGIRSGVRLRSAQWRAHRRLQNEHRGPFLPSDFARSDFCLICAR